jgi:Ubiquitin-2 like Rad60 SUMO-like
VIYVWHLDASDLVTFEYLREHRYEQTPPIADEPPQLSSPLGSTDDAASEADAQSVADDDDDVFTLVVRSGVTKDVTLKVRPTTTCGAIVKAFLKRAGIVEKHFEGKSSRGRLMIDGEHMDPHIPISEMDLEDGDQVEVTGL